MSLLLIRADAGPRIGAGHLLRCLALAQAWRSDGGEAVIASRGEGDTVRRRVEAAGVEWLTLSGEYPDPVDPGETLGIAACRIPSWVMLDGYHFTPGYQRRLRAEGHRLLMVDDMAHQPAYDSDLLLNQNIGAERLAYHTAPDTRRLLGPRYVLLRREFQEWRDRRREVGAKAGRVLVTLGGSDPDNVTLKAIQALGQVPGCEARVLVGPFNPHVESLRRVAGVGNPRIVLLDNVTDMPAMMDWADAAISGGGGTCWELAFMGVPSLVVVLAENQRGVAEGLAQAEAAVNLGWHAELKSDRIGEVLRDILGSPADREGLAARGRSLVDGEGCDRVVAEMNGRPFRLRLAREEDCRLLWEWANDTSVRAVSFTPGPIPWETHVAWFAAKRSDPAVRVYVAIDHTETPVGQVRFVLDGEEATVSMSLDRNFRGMGLGSLALDLASQRFCRERPATRVIHAYIRPGNEASVRAFLKAGFQPGGTTEVGGQSALDFIRRRGDV